MREVLEQVGELMAIAARTAPKSGGSDFVHVHVIKGNDVQKIGEGMIRYGEEKNIPGFISDGKHACWPREKHILLTKWLGVGRCRLG